MNIHVARMHSENVTRPASDCDSKCKTDDNNVIPDINCTDENTFKWGNLDHVTFTKNLDEIYGKVVFWRQNLFKLPSGAAGKAYIKETTRLVSA